MGHFNAQPKVKANGTISPSVFVVVDPTADDAVLQASATTSVILGISQEGMRDAPGLTGSDNTIAARQGDPIQIFGIGDNCLLVAGTGGYTRGDLLMAEANTGRGITRTSGKPYGAIALQSAAAGARARVVVTGPMGA